MFTSVFICKSVALIRWICMLSRSAYLRLVTPHPITAQLKVYELWADPDPSRKWHHEPGNQPISRGNESAVHHNAVIKALSKQPGRGECVCVWISAHFLPLLHSPNTQVHCGRGRSIGEKRQPKKEKEDEEELYGHSRKPGNDSAGKCIKPDGLHFPYSFIWIWYCT